MKVDFEGFIVVCAVLVSFLVIADGQSFSQKPSFGFTRPLNKSLPHEISAKLKSGNMLLRAYSPLTENLIVEYNGGRVLKNPIPVNIVFYGGGWPGKRVMIVEDFISSFSAGRNQGVVPSVSQWWKISQEYTDSSGVPISSKVNLQSAISDPGSVGVSGLQASGLQGILKNAFNRGKLIPSSNGIYLILTGPDVTVSGFCSGWCGMHQAFRYKNFDIVYAIIGNAQSQCPDQCSAFTAFRYASPDGDLGVDSMVNIIAHSISGAASNPDGNGWYHSQEDGNYGFEEVDFCNFKFSATYSTNWNSPRPVVYSHVGVNGRKFYIQDNYSLRKQACTPADK